MFETDLDKRESYVGGKSSWIWDKFFPISIAERPDYLIIQDRRVESEVMTPVYIAAAIWAVLDAVAFSYFDSFLIFLVLALLMALLLFFALIAYSYFFCQTIVFYKNKDTYEIINKRPFLSQTDSGFISDLKEIRICLNYYKIDGDTTLVSTSKLIPNDFILNDFREHELERKTMNNNYDATFRIATTVADFLEIPYSEENIGNF